VAFPPAPELGCDGVAPFVLRRQAVDVSVRDGGHDVDEVIDPIGVDRDTEAQFSFDLVALGYRDVAHVVAEPGHPHAAEGCVPDGGVGPHSDAFHHRGVCDVTRDRLASQTHARLGVAELTVAVRRLVEVHEVHVDVGPGQLDIGLRVQMQQRLAEEVEPRDPHLRRTEGVHPRDHSHARVGGVRLERQPSYRICVGENGLGHDRGPDGVGTVQRLGHLERLAGDLPQHLVAVEPLAPGQEPDLPRVADVHRAELLPVTSVSAARTRSGSARRDGRCPPARSAVGRRAVGQCAPSAPRPQP
jgi:hypothetical protein